MTLYILLWVLYCMASGLEHAWYRSINHARATLTRIAIGLLVVYGMCGAGAPFVLYLNCALALSFIFTVVFDMTYNRVKGQHLFYIGSTSTLDKLMRKSPPIAWFIKFWLMGVSITVLYTSHETFLIRVNQLINEWLF